MPVADAGDHFAEDTRDTLLLKHTFAFGRWGYFRI
jgi:hypothetical protein